MAAANAIGLEASQSPTRSQQPSAWWNPHPLCGSSLSSPSFSASLFLPLCVCVFFCSVSLFLFFPFSSYLFLLLRSVSRSPRLCGTPLGWLLLAAPVPPTLSLDMLFIGLQRGWLTVQGGSCLKQCSLNKEVRSSRGAAWLICSLSISHQASHTRVVTSSSHFLRF